MGIAPLVEHRVHLEVVEFAGAIHELPKASSAHARGSHRVEGAFDDGQILHLIGHSIEVEGLFEHGEILLLLHESEVKPARHDAKIKPYVLTHHAIHRHRHHSVQIAQPGFDDRIGQGIEFLDRERACRMQMIVGIAAHIVTVEQRIVRDAVTLCRQHRIVLVHCMLGLHLR